MMKKEIAWAFEVWDHLLEDLSSRDNHKSSRAAPFLAHLAISDSDKRLIKDFPVLWELTKDPEFVTAGHFLQSIRRVELTGNNSRK